MSSNKKKPFEDIYGCRTTGCLPPNRPEECWGMAELSTCHCHPAAVPGLEWCQCLK